MRQAIARVRPVSRNFVSLLRITEAPRKISERTNYTTYLLRLNRNTRVS